MLPAAANSFKHIGGVTQPAGLERSTTIRHFSLFDFERQPSTVDFYNTMEENITTTMDASPPRSPTMENLDQTPRLLITKMELENFKSYAGVKEIGPFHKCFSAVVGPNGSGKSNVIDAMLFVFGKRAKKLRLNKVSELIHKSDACSDATFARVSVYFQDIIDTGPGDEDYELVPGTETVISRIARKDNSSSYKIDGKNCQFKEVAAYLGSKGIDLDNNRFLILQGEVEMISMMPPKGKNEGDEGLLEYLEDIIGSNKFVEETEQAAEVVEALTEQRQEKLNRVKAIEKEKDSLQGAKQEAEQLLRKEHEIRRKQNILYQINTMNSSQELEKYRTKKAAAEEKLAAEREKLGAADERLRELESALKHQKAEYNKVHAELEKTAEEFSAYERRDTKLREEIKYCKAQKKKLEAKIKQHEKTIEECQEKAKQAEESIPQLEADIVELTEVKASEDAALEEIYEQMKDVVQKLRAELEQKTQELAPVNQERAVFQAALDTATTEVTLLEDGVTRAKERLVEAEEELAAIDQKQETKRQELAASKDELNAAKNRLIEAEAEEKALADKESKLSKRYTQLMAQAEEAKANQDSTGGPRISQAVRGILEAARQGGELSRVGVIGRLGDLATIGDEYDIAVSTACGMLDNIVVQTTAGAQRCLEFLRKHNLGRAKFIPLDKMKKGAHDRVVETPENAPRLFDLITPKNHAIAPALYLAVGETLVANDLETATRWAYDFGKRWRVVTKDGKLIEASGTMSGGGSSVRRGGMKLASGRGRNTLEEEDVPDNSKSIEEEAEKAQELLKECREGRKNLVEEIRGLNKRIKVLEAKLPKLSVEVDGCDTTRTELTKFIPELRSKCKLSEMDSEKLAELKQKVNKCKTDMSACAMLASKLEADVARLQKAIIDAGGSKLKKQQNVCEKALEKLNATEKALNQAKVSIGSMEKAVAKAEKAKIATEKELEECISKTANFQEEFKSLEEDAYKVMQAFEKVKLVESDARESLDEASKECEQLKQSQAEVKCVEVELVAKIDDLDKQIAEIERKKKKWENDLAKLRAAAEDDDELDYDSESDVEGAESKTPDDGDVVMEESQNEDKSEQSNVRKQPRSYLPEFSCEELQKYDKDEILSDIAVLETERNMISKHANMGAIAEYRKKEADYLSRVAELDAVTEERNSARKRHEDLRRQRLEMFMDGFGQITLKLKEMYQMITLGGDAELELVDSLDPFSEGIVFSVRPPKKSWKNISNLSGGEKTLSSLALVFALHHFKPTPLYVMDEIDAALDFKNVSIVANYIKERTRNAQFIIISLRNNMFELADRLVGIYKTNNCTKSVSINPRAFGIAEASPNVPVTRTPGALSERQNNSSRNKDEQVESTFKDAQRRVSFQQTQPSAVDAL